MFVDPRRRGDPLFEDLKGNDEESRQSEEPLGSAIAVRAGLETASQEAIKRRDRSILPAQLVVERKDFEDQPGAQAKGRWRSPLSRVERRTTKDHLAIKVREACG